MKYRELTKNEMVEINGGWWKLVVGVLVEMVRDAIDNPNDFYEGFNMGRTR